MFTGRRKRMTSWPRARARRIGVSCLAPLLAVWVANARSDETRPPAWSPRAAASADSGAASAALPTPSDTAAARAAWALPDSAARIRGLKEFLTRYPDSPLRLLVYGRILDMENARDPAQAGAFARASLVREREPAARGRLRAEIYLQARRTARQDSAAVSSAIRAMLADSGAGAAGCLIVASDLAKRQERLDLALKLAAAGASRSMKEPRLRAICLQTKASLHLMRQEFAEAIESLRQAVALLNPADAQDARKRLAEAYEAAGRKAEARATYEEILVYRVSPSTRVRWEALTNELKIPMEKAERELEARRRAAAETASDFSLKDLEGQLHRLSDYAGRVVLLVFWSPT